MCYVFQRMSRAEWLGLRISPFLIDECLSPTLAEMAHNHGFPESMHVNWLGLRSRQDWTLVQRAVDDGYVLVTNNSTDFTSLVDREPRHPGLVCINIAASHMSLGVQQRLFEYAIAQVTGTDLTGQVVEITLTDDSTVRFDRFPSGSA